MIFGKLLGMVLGWLALGPAGALLGLAIGHFFDRGLVAVRDLDSPALQEIAESVFFETLFTLMGQMAKADGRISEAEIAHASELMSRFGFSQERRQAAVELFRRGSGTAFNPEPLLDAFLLAVARQPLLKTLLLEYLLAAALADDTLHEAETALLVRVACRLGFDRVRFKRQLSMLEARSQFRRQDTESARPAGGDRLEAAYRALGMSPEASDREVKAAYRRLMGQHHPDRLIARGVTEAMLRQATERSQQIQAAYDLVQRARAA